MNTKNTRRTVSQWGTLTALSTVILAPLTSAPHTAQAASGDRYAQAGRRMETMSGIVTQDLKGREFRMRNNAGREFRVIIDAGREPRALSRNDRVSVKGYFSSGLFIANSLTMVNNNGGMSGSVVRSSQATSVSGTVMTDLRGREFRMRSDAGREFRVIIDAGREPRALSHGDRVQVRGHFHSGLFIANSLSMTRNMGRPGFVAPRGAGGYPGARSASVDFSGRVVSKSSSRNYVVRGMNGATYTVQSSRSPERTVVVGDTIRVYGRGSGRSVQADRILLVSHNGGSGAWNNQNYRNGQAVSFSGTVLSVSRVVGMVGNLQVRGTNGRVYRVRASNAMSFRAGNRVRVFGTYSNGTVNASSIARY